MADFLKKTLGRIVDYFKNLEKGQRTRLVIFAVLAVAIIAAASMLLNQKSYTVLYSGMDAADAGEVLSQLSGIGVDAKAKGTDTILVESSKADSVRMQLAADGYPKSGFNFDIFSKASGLGTTDMERRVYFQFQLQDNLSKAIKKMSKILDAVVNLSLADESAFVLSSDQKPASASVLLKLKDGETLTDKEARTIGELVAKSVSNLSLDNVRIVDSNMKLYNLKGEDDAFENVGTQLQLEQAVKDKLQTQVINLLTPVFGEKHVLAEVNVGLNFDKQTSSSVQFTPPMSASSTGLAVSMQALAEAVKGGGSASGVAGLDLNGANSTASYPQVSADPNSVYSKVSQEANYELNETRTQIEQAQGRIRDLSVAIVLDSSNSEDDYTENVKSLVANAIGVDPGRISVELLPFAKLENPSADGTADAAFNAQKEMLNTANSAATTRLLIIAGTAVLMLALLIVAIHTLRRRPVVPAYSVSEEPGQLIDYQAGDEDMLPGMEAPAEDFPEIPQKEDTVLTQLERYVDKSPDAVAQLLRNWLSDENK